MSSTNRYLQDVFIPAFWHNNIQVISKNDTAEFTLIPEHVNLDDVCVLKEYRKIRNDHTFSYGNKFHLIESPLKHSIAKQKIEIRKCCDDGFIAYFVGRHLAVSEVVEPTKPSMVDLEIQKKIDAIALAEKLKNVTEAARISGVSRQTIYKNRRLRRLLKEKGPQALKRIYRQDHHHKNRTEKEIENVVIAFSLENSHLGQVQVFAQLKANHRIELSPAGVRYVWLRENMQTSALRVQRSQSTLALV